MSPPWLYFGLAWGVCLACSTLGFKRIVYFVSLSYALSMGAQAIVFSAILSSTISAWPLVQSALLFTMALAPSLGKLTASSLRNSGVDAVMIV